MKTEKIILISCLFNLICACVCLAGTTSISGPAYFIIPEHLEVEQETNEDSQSPAVSSAGKEFEIQTEVIQTKKEEEKEQASQAENKIIQVEEKTTCAFRGNPDFNPGSKTKYETIIYTIYAR